MAVTFTCDRCRFKTIEPGVVKRYILQIRLEEPPRRSGRSSASAEGVTDLDRSCTVDLCDKCVERGWRAIHEQIFRAER